MNIPGQNNKLANGLLQLIEAFLISVFTLFGMSYIFSFLTTSLLVVKEKDLGLAGIGYGIALMLEIGIVNTAINFTILNKAKSKRNKAFLILLVFLLSSLWMFQVYEYNTPNKFSTITDKTAFWQVVSRDDDYRQPHNDASRYHLKFPNDPAWTSYCSNQEYGRPSASGKCYVANQQQWVEAQQKLNPYNLPDLPENTPNLCSLKIIWPFSDIQSAISTTNNVTAPIQRADCDEILRLIKQSVRSQPYN